MENEGEATRGKAITPVKTMVATSSDEGGAQFGGGVDQAWGRFFMCGLMPLMGLANVSCPCGADRGNRVANGGVWGEIDELQLRPSMAVVTGLGGTMTREGTQGGVEQLRLATTELRVCFIGAERERRRRGLGLCARDVGRWEEVVGHNTTASIRWARGAG
jgi:hypothetical protein